MTTNIQLLRSSIAYKRPSAAPLLDGQAAINLNAAEPGLFWRLTNGQLAKAGPVAITDNGMEPNAAPAGETGNSLGEEWLDSHPALHAPILHVFNGTEFVTANGFTVDKSTGDLTLLRKLEVTELVAGTSEINGNMVLAGNLTPAGQNCAFYLGLPNERWDYLYSCNFDTSFDGKVGRNLTVGEDATIENNLIVSQHVASNLTPDVDSTRNLGRSDKQWIGWFSNLEVSGSMQLGSGCSSSTITLNGAVNLNCDILPNAHNSRDIGTSANRLKALYSQSLVTLSLTSTEISGHKLTGDVTVDHNVRSIGTSAARLKALYATDVYTGDLHLKNEKGDWTMIEAENYLTIRNNKTGKTFRLLMEEV